jgi:apolipoprotein N-acyltransferase
MTDMSTIPSNKSLPTDRLAWLWLIIGAVLIAFASLQPSLPLAAWLAPVFLLRFVRTRRARVGLSLVALAQCVALGINWSIGTAPNAILAIPGVIVGLLYTCGYAVDKLLAPRLSGLPQTLVFPLAMTAVDWLGSLLASTLTPFLLPSLLSVAATWDSPGYTQTGNLLLLQIVALTGMWGLTFLMTFFASTVNALWENNFNWQPARASLIGFGAALAVVLLWGGAQLAFFQPAQPSVRVAAIASRDDLFATISDVNPGDLMPGTPAQRASIGITFAPIAEDLLARTVREARAGAKIITWAETGAPMLEEDMAALIKRAGTVAHEEQIYLQIGVIVFRNTDHYPFMENRAILFDPAGAVVWDYHKANPTPGENMKIAAGPHILPTVDTPYGRLATLICYDADFPDLARQAGKAGVDILLAPYKDWESVSAQHAQMATFRAIENGVWMVRPSLSGVSTIVDPQGRVLTKVSAFGPDEPTVVATIASQGTPTPYAQFGDVFAYLCLIGLAMLDGAAIAQRRQSNTPNPLITDEPVKAPLVSK